MKLFRLNNSAYSDMRISLCKNDTSVEAEENIQAKIFEICT